MYLSVAMKIQIRKRLTENKIPTKDLEPMLQGTEILLGYWREFKME